MANDGLVAKPVHEHLGRDTWEMRVPDRAAGVAWDDRAVGRQNIVVMWLRLHAALTSYLEHFHFCRASDDTLPVKLKFSEISETSSWST